MSKEIAKSPEILEKETLIKELQDQLVKRKRTLKGLKTKLENTKNKITEIQRAGSGQIMSKMSKMEKLRLEILELVKEMRKIKGLSRADKAALKDMEQEFGSEDMFGENFKDYKEQMAEIDAEDFDFEGQFDANERAKMRDIFEMFAVKPNKEEQKDIRKIFIRLSQKFHPDKAPTKADEEEYHLMMQKINEAYQAGDIQTLLELEQLFLYEKLDLTKVQSLSVDVLDQEIDRLERDLQFINNQIDRNGQELKNLRASEMGQMLTDMKRAEKEGAGMDAALAQLDESIERLDSLKVVFSECIELGNTKPLEEMMKAEQLDQPSPQEMMAMLNDMMNGDLDPNDLADMFGMPNDDDDDDQFDPFGLKNMSLEVPDAKFKIGDSVKINKRYIDGGVQLGDLQGRVQGSMYGERNKIEYDIELDGWSIKKLPLTYIESCVENELDFQNFEIPQSKLKACEERDTEGETLGAYRKYYHRYAWSHLPQKDQNTLNRIMQKKPELSDVENWEYYLGKKLKFPLKVKSRGLLEFRKEEKMTIEAIAGMDPNHGVLIEGTFRQQYGIYPLADLRPLIKDAEIIRIFDLYYEWAKEFTDILGDMHLY